MRTAILSSCSIKRRATVLGIYAMQLYLYSGAAHLEQSYPLLIAMAVIVVLVMVIYGVAVARTANREIGKLNYKPNS